MSTTWSSSSLTSQPTPIASEDPGKIKVEVCSGSPSASNRTLTNGVPGIRTPTVFFLACCIRRGTSEVAGKMNVYGPGVNDLINLKSELLITTN